MDTEVDIQQVEALIRAASATSPASMANFRLDTDTTSRSKTVAARGISRGTTIMSDSSITTALLTTEKGNRCDFCHSIPSGSAGQLLRCTGCSAYRYCGPSCQKRAWKAHHKRMCGSYPRYAASKAYEHLPANEKVDAALLSHFLGKYFWSEGSVDEAKKNPRIIVFLSLLQSFPPPDVPSTCGSSVPAGVNPSELFSRFGNNNFVIHSHLKPYAHGIFPFASRLFNHSCVANAAPMYVIKPGQLVRMNVIALRDIALDEEITIPYLDPALPLDDRQRALQANYGFTCSCALCKFEEQMDPGDPPTIEEGLMGSSEISRLLQEYTDCILTRRPTYSDRLRVYEDIPKALHVFFHPSVVPKLSEMFSETSHEGPFEKALNVGHVLLAVYILVYPPNYPQTGLHALEMAKTAWNAFITSSEANGADTNSPDHQLLDNVDWYLDVARHTLGTLGPEGDEGGPLQELALLAGLVNDERN